jgi:U32 family peptidase
MTEMSHELRKPELLAPAGSPDALRAALAAGADAVYLGVETFNARRNAANFSYDDLAAACDRAHLAGRRVYLTLNTLILPDEMPAALDVAAQAWHRGVDALIVQDLGLFAELRACYPEIELHTSTQMGIHDSVGVSEAARLGAARVTLAREMSLPEIAAAAHQGVDVEVFVHGALCVCYSGQCLMSSLIGGRSANRGRCAQPCRLPYALVDTSTGKHFTQEGEYTMSPKDLCGIDLLPALIRAGVASLKIEGRMKSPAYAAVVTGVYRAALDRAYAAVCADADATYKVTDEERQQLTEAFSRGFSTAYLEGERGLDLMSSRRPNNRGIQVGRVSGMKDGVVTLDLDVEVGAGDVLEFWTSQGRFTQEMSSITPDPAHAGRVRVVIGQPVSKGDRVFRVRNAELLRAAAARFGARAEAGNSGLVALDARVVVHIGEPLLVCFSRCDDAANATGAVVEGEATGSVVETARTKPLTVADVEEHVGRLGNTPYAIRHFDIDLDEGAGLGFSVLHRVRAEAIVALEEALLAPYRLRSIRALDRPRVAHAPVQKKGLAIAVLVDDEAAARAAHKAGADAVYRHVLAREVCPDAGEESGTHRPAKAIPALPSVVHDAERAGLLAHVRRGKPVMVGTRWLLDACREQGALPELASSYPVTNAAALTAVAEAGAQMVWLSPELSCTQIAALSATSPVPLGLTVFGRQEMMVTEHCMLMAKGPCDRRCASCARRKAPHLLEDRKDYRFPVRTDDAGRCHIYNAVPLDLTASFPQIVTAGISSVLIDATLLTTTEIAAEVTRARRAAEIALKHGEALKKREGFTTGHFFQGVN